MRKRIHQAVFDLDDLVQTDLTGLDEAVEDYVEECREAHGIEDSEIEYGWSCNVFVEIFVKEASADGTGTGAVQDS